MRLIVPVSLRSYLYFYNLYAYLLQDKEESKVSLLTCLLYSRHKASPTRRRDRLRELDALLQPFILRPAPSRPPVSSVTEQPGTSNDGRPPQRLVGLFRARRGGPARRFGESARSKRMRPRHRRLLSGAENRQLPR